jgi:hypothetical protein
VNIVGESIIVWKPPNLQAVNRSLEGRVVDAGGRAREVARKLEGSLAEQRTKLTEAESVSEALENRLKEAQEAAQVHIIVILHSFYLAKDQNRFAVIEVN